jgi:serine/threonine-protein kinase HipA
MTLPEHRHAVLLGDARVGALMQRGDYTRFVLSPSYLADPDRPVLGLIFEQDLGAKHAAALRLPAWFSNLLPEGKLREWIAADRKVSPRREMELLAQVGRDLPGAVRVIEDRDEHTGHNWSDVESVEPLASAPSDRWRFSLAGVGLKFSMLAKGDRLSLPAFGAGGDWIVKLPDPLYADVPRNEFAMMSLASAVGIDVPEIRLVHRDQIDGLPANVWPEKEQYAYAIRRFDRTADRSPVHIEDLAQVRNFYPERKYEGNYESLAALVYRGRDVPALREFARRLTFTMLISNGDAHLKNWSLIYADPRIPTLAPAYDLVSTRYYMGGDERLGLKFAGSRRFEVASIGTFELLERKLRVDAGLSDTAAQVVRLTNEHWLAVVDVLAANRPLRDDIESSIRERSRTLTKTTSS